MIHVAKDSEGLRQAALEEFECGLIEMARPKLREKNESLAEGLQSPERTLSPIYYERVEYLMGLETLLGAEWTKEILSEDCHGLRAIAEARKEFRARHRACKCGALAINDSDTLCWNCWQPYEEKK
jgi:hypothetical protein